MSGKKLAEVAVDKALLVILPALFGVLGFLALEFVQGKVMATQYDARMNSAESAAKRFQKEIDDGKVRDQKLADSLADLNISTKLTRQLLEARVEDLETEMRARHPFIKEK